MVRILVRASRKGVCKVSTGVCHNGGNAGVGQSVSVHIETDWCQQVRYVHSLIVYGAGAGVVNFYVASAMKYYGAGAVNNQEPIPTE